jgi:exonuclease III
MAVKILQFNINGLMSKFKELKQTLINMDIGIVCLQETFLKENKSIKIPGYTIIRKDRPSHKGGLAIIIKNSLKYQEIINDNQIEYQEIKLFLQNENINLLNLYIAPHVQTDSPNLETIFKDKSKSIILGDFNAHNLIWGSSHNSSRGKTIESIIDRNNLIILNTGHPTYFQSNAHPSAIDLSICTSNISTKIHWNICNNSMGSDHHPILITYNEPPVEEDSFIPRWKFSKADWKTFEQKCHQQLTPSTFNPSHSVEENLEKFQKTIIEIAIDTIPKTKKPNKKQKLLPYWNDAIKQAM